MPHRNDGIHTARTTARCHDKLGDHASQDAAETVVSDSAGGDHSEAAVCQYRRGRPGKAGARSTDRAEKAPGPSPRRRSGKGLLPLESWPTDTGMMQAWRFRGAG